MDSNEGKWASHVKTVCKITRLIPGSSLQVPGLWKQQNCPAASVTKLTSTVLVPVIPRALRILVLLKRGQTFPVSAGSHSASQEFLHGGIRRRIFCALRPPLLVPCLTQGLNPFPSPLCHAWNFANLSFQTFPHAALLPFKGQPRCLDAVYSFIHSFIYLFKKYLSILC